MRLNSLKVVAALLMPSLLIGACFYIAMINFSDHREYTKYSFEYLLITSKEITDISEYCNAEPQFTYSAADGSKPSILKIDCDLDAAVMQYFLANQYSLTDSGSYKNNNNEFEIIKVGGKITSIVQLIYL